VKVRLQIGHCSMDLVSVVGADAAAAADALTVDKWMALTRRALADRATGGRGRRKMFSKQKFTVYRAQLNRIIIRGIFYTYVIDVRHAKYFVCPYVSYYVTLTWLTGSGVSIFLTILLFFAHLLLCLFLVADHPHSLAIRVEYDSG
jgi:hypothetical protein